MTPRSIAIENRPLSIVRSRPPAAPTEAASVGEATPMKIDPSTPTMRTKAGRRARPTRLTSVGPEGRDLAGGDRRRQVRLPPRDEREVDDVEDDQHEPRDDRPDVEVAHRHAHDVAHEDEDDARRDDLAERPRRADGAADELLVVAAAEHGGERDQPHGDDAGAHDAGGGGQDGADHHHRDGDPAPEVAEEEGHRLEQLLGQPRFLERDPHEDEERHGQEREVRHRAPDADGQDVEEVGTEEAERDADRAEEEPGEGQAEGHREAEEQERDHAGEHEGRQHLVERQLDHGLSGPPSAPRRRSPSPAPGRRP